MLKPGGDPSGSAFLKVDPSYLQHWQQLFPQAQLKAPLVPPPPHPDRLSLPVDGLRPSRLHSHLLASTHCSSSSSSSSTSAAPSSSSSSSSSSAALTPSSSSSLSQLPVPQQIALFGQALAPVQCAGPGGGDLLVVVPPDNQLGHNLHQAKEQSCGGVGVGVVSSSVKSGGGGGEDGGGGKGASTRFKLTSEQLDYYLCYMLTGLMLTSCSDFVCGFVTSFTLKTFCHEMKNRCQTDTKQNKKCCGNFCSIFIKSSLVEVVQSTCGLIVRRLKIKKHTSKNRGEIQPPTFFPFARP
ncbi:hypothetical protein F2P81_025204 [Scophthalmus maximus]|uniref:Uncharacterized protein n=1 Tax=Scophthalmus maximus TaxID=52904 RepID=A0A6A4RRB5_SCOMX|nr:hypothetical protein F2P81_025204 [Scophthalmus maximus]